MPEHFTSGNYEPEIVKTMGQAFDLAFANFTTPTPAAAQVLADAIIEGVKAGEREPLVLAKRATIELRKAIEGGLVSE
jgi:hypothetical protein